MNHHNLTHPIKKAGILRRLMAMIYDSFIVAALLMAATALLLPFTHGQAIAPSNMYYSTYLVMVIGAYFISAWAKISQTIGMRAWRLKVFTFDGKPLDVRQATLRFWLAGPSLLLGGIGLWWSLIDKDKLAWHDRLSHTSIFYKSP